MWICAKLSRWFIVCYLERMVDMPLGTVHAFLLRLGTVLFVSKILVIHYQQDYCFVEATEQTAC